MLDLFNNKIAFLKEKPKLGFLIVILIFSILIFLLFYMIKKEIYDTFQTKGLVKCNNTCTVTTIIPTNLDFEQLMLNNKKINYKIESKELKISEENMETYYELVLFTEEPLTNKEIVDLNFYYNKQRIITKIKEKMF